MDSSWGTPLADGNAAESGDIFTCYVMVLHAILLTQYVSGPSPEGRDVDFRYDETSASIAALPMSLRTR
jgi:hypothetical protein